jgi:hypothetical protein
MSDVAPLSIKVIVDSSGVAKGVQVATQGLDQITARTSKVMTAFGNLKTTMLGVLGGNLLTNAVMLVGHELNAMKQETVDLQQQTIRLNQALSGVGITSQKVQKDVFTAADSFYQLGFQGSEAISAMGTLVTATGSVSQAQKLMAMSADLARYKHIDMETAAKILARGTQGSAKAFKELGITLDTTIPKNEAITRAFDELNQKIGGQAQAYTKSFAGQMAVLKERMDNLFQTIGAKVLPILAAFVGYITTNGQALLIYGGIVLSVIAIIKTYTITLAAVKSVQQAYAFWTYAQAASTNVFRFALSALWATMKANPVGFIIAGIMALGAAFVWAWNHFKGFREAIVKGLQIVLNTIGYVVGGVSTLIKALSYLPGMGKLKDVAKGVDKIAGSIRGYSDNLDKLADKKISTPKIPGIVAPGMPTGIQGQVPGGDAKVGGSKTGGGGGDNTIVQNIVVYASNTNDISKNVSKIAKNGMPIGAK